MAVTVKLPLVPPTQISEEFEGWPVMDGAATTVTDTVFEVTEEQPLPEALTMQRYW